MPSFTKKSIAFRTTLGLVAGVAISFVDNLAFEGEVSPIVIVALLFTISACVGAIWGQSGWFAVVLTWICLPFAHLVKHIIGLPNTLHPNTYTSILMLAIFTFVIAAIGIGCGVLIHRHTTKSTGNG